MNTDKNQYGVDASLPNKIFSTAKNLNLKWNFNKNSRFINYFCINSPYHTHLMELNHKYPIFIAKNLRF